MARYGLDLQQKNSGNRKRLKIIVVAFLCFSLLLGSVSMLLLWRSLNYDFNNIFVKSDESTTAPPETTLPEQISYSGKHTYLIAVVSDDGKETLFINAVNVDLSQKVIRVVPVDGEIENSDGVTCSKLLVDSGIKSVVDFLEKHYVTDICRYALLTETQFKSFFRTMGDLIIKINDDVEYDTADMFLELSRGENTLNPDKTYKYMKYLCETEKGYERAKANADIVVAAFKNYCTLERFASCDSIFSVVINYCETDISIVDFTNAKEELEYLMPKTSKETLKVFVSDNIKGEEVGERNEKK